MSEEHTTDDRHDALDRDNLDGAVPEADLLEQERPALEDDYDPEAPSDQSDSARIPRTGSTTDANEADIIEQSQDVPADDDDDRGNPE